VEKHGENVICHSQASVGGTFSAYFSAIDEVPEEQCSGKKEQPGVQG